MNILLFRIKDLSQYNAAKKQIIWSDSTQTRWDNYYSNLVNGDKALATIAGKGSVFIGTISTINSGTQIIVSDVEELKLRNDDLLRIDAIFPEKVSRMKASFQPFIPDHLIDWNKLVSDIKSSTFIKYYIVKGEEFESLKKKNLFKNNDRIALLKEGKFDSFGKFNSGNIEEIGNIEDIYNVKGKTLNEVLEIQKNNVKPDLKRGSNKVILVEEIIQELLQKPYFEFGSFFTYYDILHNKSLYLNAREDGVEDEFADYYVVGMSWGSTNDQSERFYANGIWENGRSEQEDKDAVNAVPVNTRIAAKSAFPQAGKSIFRVKRYGTVIENPNDGKTLKVLWDDPMEPFDIISHVAGRYSGTIKKVLEEDINAIFYPEKVNTNSNSKSNNMKEITSLNTILFGPPGTGKTFNTIDESLKIVAKKEYQGIVDKKLDEQEERKQITDLFDKYLIKSKNDEKIDWDKVTGKIAFCTFHQSFSYEDFIEGIKPNTDGKTISYKIEDGLFKLMCNLASKGSLNKRSIDIPVNSRFTKLLLSSKNEFDYCIKNNLVGVSKNVSSSQENYFKTAFDSVSNTHVVLVTFDNITINAIGIIKGQAITDLSGTFKFIRNVEWLAPDCSISISDIYKAPINGNVLDDLDEKLVRPVIEENLKSQSTNDNYVLIIDEINRGNISQIFGELITLIESDKRKDTPNELSAILPYSKTSFSVPNNLYLIGTMNTADRSVEALDTALRRRFDFIEMLPNISLIQDDELKSILKTINLRLKVLLGKDHQIGHSYFLKVGKTDSLQNVFKNNIIPLMQEYFYGDFAKIAMVVGESFIKSRKIEDFKKELNTDVFFAYNGHEAIDDYEIKEVWELNNEIFEEKNEKKFQEAIKLLLKPKATNES